MSADSILLAETLDPADATMPPRAQKPHSNLVQSMKRLKLLVFAFESRPF